MSPSTERGTEPAERSSACRQIAECLRTFIDPPISEAQRSVRAVGGDSIAVLGTPAQHRWIERFLAIQLGRDLDVFDITWEVVSLPADDEDTAGDQPRILSSDQSAAWRKSHLDREDVRLVSAPVRTTFRSGERVEISALQRRAFIKDYRVWESVAPRGERLIDPIVDHVEEGLTGRGLAAVMPLANGELAIGLDFELQATEIVVIAPFQTEHGLIGLPELRKITLASTLVVKPGATILFPYRDTVGERRFVAVLTVEQE
ncbi:MAG: hypothetical protein RL885_23435 [Planctomycetota bacterium]